MLNKLLGDFINGAISAHTSQIRNQDVSLKFLQNSINITELELYKFAFFQYGFPIIIKQGIIKNIDIVVPWATFQFDPVKITIENIFILASFPGDDPTNFITDQDLHDIREHQLAAHHEFSKRFYKILKQISSQKLSQIAKRTMHSCSIEIKNLHVRIEIENQTRFHSFGFITSSINIFTQKPSKGIPPIIEKNVNFNDLSLYLDLDQEPIQYKSIEDFISIMKNLSKIDSNHQFLLEPSLITAKLRLSTEIVNSDIEILTDLNKILLSVSKKQLPIILKMASNVKKFNQFMFIKECKESIKKFKTNKENDDFDESFSWILFHTLAKKKNYSLVDSILDRILCKNKYIKEWNKLDKKSDRNSSIIKMDHLLDYQAILYFRALAESIKMPLIKMNYDEILRFVNFDPLLLIPSLASRFSILASAIKTKIKFLNQNEKFDCQIIIKGPSINYGHKKMHFGLESFDIIFKENEMKYNVLKLISPIKNIISVDATFHSFTNGSIKISSEPLKFKIDISRIFSFFASLDLNINEEMIKKIKIEKLNHQIDINLKEIHFLPFYKDNTFFDIGIQSFCAHQNQLNPKEYLCSYNGISVSDDDVYIFNNLSIESSTIHGIMNVNVPYFKINLMKKDFDKFDQLKNFCESASLLSQKVPIIPSNIKIELEGIEIYSNLLKNTITLGKSNIIYLVDLYKSEFDFECSKIEVGYMVTESLMFKWMKQPNLIQSTFSINQFYIKELQIDVNSSIPFLKGTYDHIKETMDVNLGVNGIVFKDYNAIQTSKFFIKEVFSLFVSKNKDVQIENDVDSFLKSILNLIGDKKLKIPKLNLTIHFVSKPILIIYNDFNFYINFECSLLFNPFVLALSISSLKILFKNEKYFEIKNFAFVLSQKLEIDLSIVHIDLNITDQMINEIKNQYNNIKSIIIKSSKNLMDLYKSIRSIKININGISLNFIKLFQKCTVKIPFCQLSISVNLKKHIKITTSILAECSEIGIKTEPFLLSLEYKTDSKNKNFELQILNPLKFYFHPLTLKKLISSKNILYVNQTGIELNIIIDNNLLSIPHNSSYITTHFPNNPKIFFIEEKAKTCFDISKLYGEQSIACSFNSGMILIWKTQSLLIFSSPIEIINKTGYSIQLLDDYFDNYIIQNDQIYFIPPNIESKVKILSLSFLGTKIKIRAKLLDKSYTISNGDMFYRFIVERDTKSLVARITITAPIFIRSYFPEPLLIEFSLKSGNKQIVLYPSIKVPICLFDINMNKISFKLSSFDKNKGFFHDSIFNVTLSLSAGETAVCLQEFKQGKQANYLRCRVNEENIKNDIIKTIDLSAPVFIVNQLDMRIILSMNNQDKRILSTFNSQHRSNNESMFRPLIKPPVFKYNIVPYCLVKDDEFSFYLSYPITMKYTKNKFGVARINSKELALLPTSQNDDTVMPVTFQVKHDETSTAMIVLKPYVIIYNHTDKQIKFDGNPIEIDNYLIIKSVSPSLDCVFNLYGLNIPINLENISDFSISGPSLLFRIQFSVSFIKGIKYITVSTIKSLGMFAVINETDKDFIMNQTGIEKSQYFVLSQSSFLFDLSDTRTNCSIEFLTADIPPFSAHLDHPMDINPVPGIKSDSPQIYYSVEIVENKRYVVHLYQESPSFVIEKESAMNLWLNIPSISMKIYGKNNLEYCNVTMGTFSFHILRQEMKESIVFSIDSIQIDDMNQFAEYPVVLLSVKKPFFNFGLLRTINSSFYESLICSITPIAAEIDISFVIDMLSLFNVQYKKKKEHSENEINVLASLNKNTNFHCLLLNILPIDADISIFPRTSRQFHRFEQKAPIPSFLSIIPIIENFHFQLSPINAADLRCSKKEFFLILLDNAKSSFSTQWLRLIGSAAIIGNPQKLINNFSSAFKKPAKEIPKELLIGTAGTFNAILRSGELTMKGISSTLRSVSNDDLYYINDNKTALGGLSWGFKSFVSGLSKAATGIVTKPVERAKENGIVGAFQGVNEGIVGIVTNSVSGAVDLTAGIITGVRRSIFAEKIPKRVEEPTIKHRSYIKKMNEFIGSPNSSYTVNQIEFIFCSYEADICEDFVFIGENEINIENISRVLRDENSKIVKIETNYQDDPIIVEFEKENFANEFHSILQLQIERKFTQKIFTIPYQMP